MESYPLHWPLGWPRTPAAARTKGTFKGHPAEILKELKNEIDRMVLGKQAARWRAGGVIISSNARLRRDGDPYSEDMTNARLDPGVAVYFERKGKNLCFACDTYDRIWKNLRALQLTLEALRGLERWGSTQILDRAFDGFLALPEQATAPNCWQVLDIAPDAPAFSIKAAYRIAARRTHPDQGGSPEAFYEVQEAWESAKSQRPDLRS